MDAFIFRQICHYLANYKLTRQPLMRPRLSTLWRKSNLFSRPPLWSQYSPLIDVVLAYDQEDLYRRGMGGVVSDARVLINH